MVDLDFITDAPEVGEIVQANMPRLNDYISDIARQQYEVCMDKGFKLPKYYIWILYYKSKKSGELVFRIPICRSTRPSPYQDEDMILWSVTNYDKIKCEYSIPKKQTIKYILANPDMFEKSHVEMLRKYVQDKLETLDDYLVGDKIA